MHEKKLFKIIFEFCEKKQLTASIQWALLNTWAWFKMCNCKISDVTGQPNVN